jgi:hypothetical protein
MHASTRALSWKTAVTEVTEADRLDWIFNSEAFTGKSQAQSQSEVDREILEIVEKAEARAAKEAKAARPIRIRSFEC